MKKILFCLCIGFLCSGIGFAVGNLHTYTLTESEYSLFMNCKRLEFDNPVMEREGTTYVPLREFCKKNGISLSWKDYSHWEYGKQWVNEPGEEIPESYIKLISPGAKKVVQETTVNNETNFFTPEGEQSLFSGNQIIKENIITGEQAAEVATAFARTEYGIAQYDTALYTTIYFEKYKAWLVICNYAPQEKGEMVVRPAKEWGIHVLIGGDGRLIRFFDSIYDETINTEVASQVYSRFDNNDIRPYLVE